MPAHAHHPLDPAQPTTEVEVERYTTDEFLFWAKECGLVDFDYDEEGVSFWYFVDPEEPEECTRPHSPGWAIRLRRRVGLPRRK